MTIRTMRTTTTPLAALLLLAVCQASKDGGYYSAGVSNPNTKKKMYWKEPINVLQDLDQFSKLLVRFHSCAYVRVLTVFSVLFVELSVL
jgi:hypothetical protein